MDRSPFDLDRLASADESLLVSPHLSDFFIGQINHGSEMVRKNLQSDIEASTTDDSIQLLDALVEENEDTTILNGCTETMTDHMNALSSPIERNNDVSPNAANLLQLDTSFCPSLGFGSVDGIDDADVSGDDRLDRSIIEDVVEFPDSSNASSLSRNLQANDSFLALADDHRPVHSFTFENKSDNLEKLNQKENSVEQDIGNGEADQIIEKELLMSSFSQVLEDAFATATKQTFPKNSYQQRENVKLPLESFASGSTDDCFDSNDARLADSTYFYLSDNSLDNHDDDGKHTPRDASRSYSNEIINSEEKTTATAKMPCYERNVEQSLIENILLGDFAEASSKDRSKLGELLQLNHQNLVEEVAPHSFDDKHAPLLNPISYPSNFTECSPVAMSGQHRESQTKPDASSPESFSSKELDESSQNSSHSFYSNGNDTKCSQTVKPFGQLRESQANEYAKPTELLLFDELNKASWKSGHAGYLNNDATECLHARKFGQQVESQSKEKARSPESDGSDELDTTLWKSSGSFYSNESTECSLTALSDQKYESQTKEDLSSPQSFSSAELDTALWKPSQSFCSKNDAGDSPAATLGIPSKNARNEHEQHSLNGFSYIQVNHTDAPNDALVCSLRDLPSVKQRVDATLGLDIWRGAAHRRKLKVVRSQFTLAEPRLSSLQFAQFDGDPEVRPKRANVESKPKRFSLEEDPYRPFKAKTLPNNLTGGVAGVPKIEKRPVTEPKSPHLGLRRISCEKEVKKECTEVKRLQTRRVSELASHPPLKRTMSSINKKALEAEPFTRLMSGSEASMAKEKSQNEKIERVKADARRMSTFRALPLPSMKSHCSRRETSQNDSHSSPLLGLDFIESSRKDQRSTFPNGGEPVNTKNEKQRHHTLKQQGSVDKENRQQQKEAQRRSLMKKLETELSDLRKTLR